MGGEMEELVDELILMDNFFVILLLLFVEFLLFL